MDNAIATRSNGIVILLPMVAVLLFVMNATPYVPLQDYNEWVYQGFITSQLLHGHLSDRFLVALFPVPNSAVQVLLALLCAVMPAAIAAQVLASLYVVAAATLAWLLSMKIAPAQNGGLCFLLLICVYFNSPFWNGYMNYQLGILLFSVWLLLDPAARRKPLWVFAFTIAAFFTHAMIWASLMLLVAIDALRQRQIPLVLRPLATWPALASLGLFGWYAACKHTPMMPDPHANAGLLHAVGYKLYTLAKLGPYHNFAYAGDARDAFHMALYYLGCAVNFAFAAALVYLLWGAFARPLLLRGGWRTASAEQLGALALIVVSLSMPAVIADLVNPGERVMYPALLLALSGLRGERAAQAARMARWLALAIVVLVASALGLAANGARLLPDPSAADMWSSSTPPFFLSRPGAYHDVQSILNGAASVRKVAFETGYLFNRQPATHAPTQVRTEDQAQSAAD